MIEKVQIYKEKYLYRLVIPNYFGFQIKCGERFYCPDYQVRDTGETAEIL